MAYPIGLGAWPTGAVGYALGWVVYGHFGVTVFIALAGYSLALGVARRQGQLPGGFRRYMSRRAWRIIPPYWAALIITIVLSVTVIGQPTGTHWDQSLPASPIRWVVDALLLQDVFPVRSASYTFWSIAVEWHIYLLLPLILLFRRRVSWTVAVGAGAGLASLGLVFSRLVPRVGPVGIESLWFTFYIVFALAVGACVAVQNNSPWILRAPLKRIALLFSLIIGVVCISQPYGWVSANYYWIDILVGAAVICVLASMGTGNAPALVSMFSWKPLATVGVFSYSLYLIHAPLLQVFWQLFAQPFDLTRNQTLLVMWLGGVPAMVGAAYVFYLIVEKRVPAIHELMNGLDRRSIKSRSSTPTSDIPT